MKIVEALKILYSDPENRIVYTDNELNIIWKNNEALPRELLPEKLMLSANAKLELPVTEKTVSRYYDDEQCYTVIIRPVHDDEVGDGYIFEFLSEYEVDTLAMRSTLKDRLRNDLEVVRFEAGNIIALLDLRKKTCEKLETEDNSDFDLLSRQKVLGIMSAISNYEEISRYLGDKIEGEYRFMSVVLDDLAERIKKRAEANGYIFEYDINAMVHLPMNVTRFEAAVANLAANAYMYNSKPEKKCRIELTNDNGQIILSVTDNGDGIPEEKLKKLQRPLEYNDNDDINESLGLSVAMLYCIRFGGRLEIETKKDEFTTVKMIFEDHGKEVPLDFRQYIVPSNMITDNTGCILGKCFGYFENEDM